MVIKGGEMGITPDTACRFATVIRALPVTSLARAQVTVLLDLFPVIVAFSGMVARAVAGQHAGRAGCVIDVSLHANTSWKAVQRISRILVHVLAGLRLLGGTFGKFGKRLIGALGTQFRRSGKLFFVARLGVLAVPHPVRAGAKIQELLSRSHLFVARPECHAIKGAVAPLLWHTLALLIDVLPVGAATALDALPIASALAGQIIAGEGAAVTALIEYLTQWTFYG